MTPERRRRGVTALTERVGVSERRACRVLDQPRTPSAARFVPR